jgi:hypothetical protein
MPAINFFCPCCGVKPRYSRELAETILAITINFFDIEREDVFKNWLHYDNGAARARAFTLYFLRRISGENYKVVGEIFDLPGTRAGQIIKRLEESLEGSLKGSYLLQEKAIETRILSSDQIKLLLLSKSN